MQKYKIITLLKAFSPQEIKSFGDFLESPYHNSHKKPLQLFYALIKQIEKIDEENFPKEKFFRKIYGDKKAFNNNTFNDLTSQLFHLAEDFLYFESARYNKKEKEIFLTRKYCEKGYRSLFANKQKQLKSLLDKREIDSEYFEDVYEMNVNEYNYFQIYGAIRKQKDFNFALKKILELSATLTNYYLLELSNNYINALTRRTIFENGNTEKDFGQIAEHLFDSKFINLIGPYNEHHYILEVYKKMLEMFIYLDKNFLFHEYKSSIQTFISRFSSAEKFFHYSKLISYCSLRLIKDYSDKEIRKELTHIAKEVICNKYFITSRNEHIGLALFRIFLDNFVYQKDSASIELMLKQCVPFVEKKFRNSQRNLVEMHMTFLESKYETALQHLSQVTIDYFQMSYVVKSAYIKIHYHLKNIEQILYEAESYMKFLTFNKAIPKAKKSKELDFVKMIKRIVIAESKSRYDDISYINHLIHKNPRIANKEWLLEITDDYLQKNKKVKIAR